MKFSIIIPVYNCASFLHECIDSVLKQTFSDYELILVDDGSTDDSGKICDSYSQIDSRVRVIHKKNGGANSARKAAATTVKGDYILNIDGDDFIGEGYLKRISDTIDQYKVDMVAWGYTRVDHDGNTIGSVYNKAESGLYTDDKLQCIRDAYLFDPDEIEINYGSLLYNLHDKAIKRDLYMEQQAIVVDDILEGEDASTIWLILQKVNSLYVSDIHDYYYRLNPNSVTATVNNITIERQKSLEKFLIRNVVNEWQLKQIRGFSFCRIIFIVDRAIKKGLHEFVLLMKKGEMEGIFDQCVEAEIKGISKGNALRMYLIRKHYWRLLYFYHKLRSKS